MPDKQISNPAGAYGVTDLTQELWSTQAPCLASAAVTARTVVALGTQGKVAMAATNGTASLQAGIAVGAIASGYVGNIVVAGFIGSVPCDGAVAAGDRLKRSVTTTGSVAATATPAAGEIIAVAINASASNVVDVWVCKSLATS